MGTLLHLLIICLLPFVAFLPIFDSSRNHTFISTYDDGVNILEFPCLRDNISEDLICLLFIRSLEVHEPVSMLAKWLIIQLAGKNVYWWKVITLVVHVLNAVILFRVIQRVCDISNGTLQAMQKRHASRVSLLLTLLFAIHPLRAEVICWASGQPYALAGLFSIVFYYCSLSLLSDGSFGAKFLKCLALSSVFVLAMFSKAAAVTLPYVIFCKLALILSCRCGDKETGYAVLETPVTLCRLIHRILCALWPLVPCMMLAAIPVYINWEASQSHGERVLTNAETVLRSMASIVAMVYRVGFFEAILYHLTCPLLHGIFFRWKTAFPLFLSPHYRLPTDGEQLSVMVTLLFAGLRSVVGPKEMVLCLTGGIMSVLPVLGFVHHGHPTLAADRYTYLPVLWLFPTIGAFVVQVSSEWRFSSGDRQFLRLWRLATVTIIACLVVLSSRQAKVWRNDAALWTHTLTVDPADTTVLNNMGFYLLELKQPRQALKYLEAAIAINGHHEKAALNLGTCYMLLNMESEAIRLYKGLLRDFPPVNSQVRAAYLNNLGYAFLALGNKSEAIQFLKASQHEDNESKFSSRNLEILRNLLMEDETPELASSSTGPRETSPVYSNSLPGHMELLHSLHGIHDEREVL